ncbi:MAG: ParB N-terminal domain-containing protein [Ardenticatenaceae bacterium]|nr:ParB N-terminal domain-containing protein [Ardenticatenaceae bacterium]
MAKKKTSLSQTLFRDIDPYGDTAVSDAGTLARLALDVVRPDPGQPRRLLPGALMQQLVAGTLTPRDALSRWLETADEAGQSRIHELRKLASSIAQHGLINPITVRQVTPGETAPADAQYLIVTGERRYWAHTLLALEGQKIQAGNEVLSPTEIPAIVTGPGITIRAHQLIENIMREDINAVEKALGLWALRYELSETDTSALDSADWVNYSSPPPEMELVPWTAVSDALGISKRYRIFITSVLNLSPPALALVQEYDLAEMTIRPIVQKLRDFPDLQMKALQQLLAWQQEEEPDGGPRRGITKAVQSLVEQLVAREQLPPPTPQRVDGRTERIQRTSETKRFSSKVRGTLRFMQRLEPTHLALIARELAHDMTYLDTVDELRDLRQQLEVLLSQIDDYQETDIT